MRRIKSLVMEGLGDTRDQVRALAVEVNIFGENNESFSSEKRLVIRNTGAEVTNQKPAHSDQSEGRVTVSYGDRSVTMRCQEGRILWL